MSEENKNKIREEKSEEKKTEKQNKGKFKIIIQR
jgi:hypothetical protein